MNELKKLFYYSLFLNFAFAIVSSIEIAPGIKMSTGQITNPLASFQNFLVDATISNLNQSATKMYEIVETFQQITNPELYIGLFTILINLLIFPLILLGFVQVIQISIIIGIPLFVSSIVAIIDVNLSAIVFVGLTLVSLAINIFGLLSLFAPGNKD